MTQWNVIMDYDVMLHVNSGDCEIPINTSVQLHIQLGQSPVVRLLNCMQG